MKYRLLVPAIIACITIFSACKKDDPGTPGANGNVDSANSFMQVREGNYWIYESYWVDSNGVGVRGSRNGGPVMYDSIYAMSDTTINSRHCHRLMIPDEVGGSDYELWYLADSLTYVINSAGYIILSLADSTTPIRSYSMSYPNNVLTDDSVILAAQWRGATINKTVPAGTFSTISMEYRWTYYPFAAQRRPISSKRIATRYAKGVGMISEVMPFYTMDTMYVERRLVRYHVQ